MVASSRKQESRENCELSLLREITGILGKSLVLQEVIGPIIDAISTQLDLRHVTLSMHMPSTGQILIESAPALTAAQKKRGRYKIGEGITGQVVLSGEAAVIPKVSESTKFINRTKRTSSGEFSFICVPIRVSSEVVGTLSADRAYNSENNLDADLRILSIAASLLSQSVKREQKSQQKHQRLLEENQRLRAELKDRFRPANIVGNSREMQVVYDQIAQVAQSQATVLIQGETGTGKELVAHAIHYNSNRADKPFVKVHCAALSENIIESELFGHVKGAYTGATSDRQGRFELANGGTLFLDEIAEVPTSIQIKLLRVLQEKEFERVGSTATTKVNVRLITATNKDLADLCNLGEFREDLYYRLNVFAVFVPPLRKRKADIALLSDFFLEKYSKENHKKVQRLSSAAIDMLFAYHWPGNVRELENTIERAVVVADGEVVHPHHLPPTLQTAEATGTAPQGTLKEMVEQYEKDIIVDALKSSRGNMASAARALGTTPRIFAYKVSSYNVNPKKYAA